MNKVLRFLFPSYCTHCEQVEVDPALFLCNQCQQLLEFGGFSQNIITCFQKVGPIVSIPMTDMGIELIAASMANCLSELKILPDLLIANPTTKEKQIALQLSRFLKIPCTSFFRLKYLKKSPSNLTILFVSKTDEPIQHFERVKQLAENRYWIRFYSL